MLRSACKSCLVKISSESHPLWLQMLPISSPYEPAEFINLHGKVNNKLAKQFGHQALKKWCQSVESAEFSPRDGLETGF